MQIVVYHHPGYNSSLPKNASTSLAKKLVHLIVFCEMYSAKYAFDTVHANMERQHACCEPQLSWSFM